MEGTFEFLSDGLWHTSYEGETMLLSPSDRLLMEWTPEAWYIRVEHLAPDAPGPIMRLRQRRRNLLAAERRAAAQTIQSRGKPLDSILENNAEAPQTGDSTAPLPTMKKQQQQAPPTTQPQPAPAPHTKSARATTPRHGEGDLGIQQPSIQRSTSESTTQHPWQR